MSRMQTAICIKASLKPYVVVAGGYEMTGTGEDKNKFSGLLIGGGLGVSCFVNKKSSVDLQLSYSHESLTSKEDKNDKFKTNQFSPTLGFTIFL
ncbi:hypothetical protein [Niabella drilacis]|nr:hypothetical protein [Niabella drilacis]